MTASAACYLSLVKTRYLLERVQEARQIVPQADLNRLGSDLHELKEAIQSLIKSGGPFNLDTIKKTVASFRPRLYELIPAETKEQKILKKVQFFNKYANELKLECVDLRLKRYAAKIQGLSSQPRSNRPLLISATKILIEADATLKLRREQASVDKQVKSFWGSDAVPSLPKTGFPIFANTFLDDETHRITAVLHFLIAAMKEDGPSCLHQVIQRGKKTAEALKKETQEDLLAIAEYSCLERLLPQPIFLDGGDKNCALLKILSELEGNGTANGFFIVSGIFTFGNESFGIVLNYGRLKKLVGIFDPCGYTKLRHSETDKLAAYFIAFKDLKSAADFLANRLADQPLHLSGQLLPLKLKEKSTTRLNWRSETIQGTAPRPVQRRSLQSYLQIACDAAASVRARQGRTLSDFLNAARLTPHYAKQTSRGPTLTEIYCRLDALRDAVAAQDKPAIKQAFQLLSGCPLPSTIRNGNISDFLYEQLYLHYKVIWESNRDLLDPHQEAFNNQFGQLAFHGETNIVIAPQFKLTVIDEVKKTLKSNWRI